MSPHNPKRIVKTKDSGYFLDRKTNTVINGNLKDLTTYRNRVQDFLEVDRVRSEMKELTRQVEEIKRALLLR